VANDMHDHRACACSVCIWILKQYDPPKKLRPVFLRDRPTQYRLQGIVGSLDTMDIGHRSIRARGTAKRTT